jgi:hypothetical protein
MKRSILQHFVFLVHVLFAQYGHRDSNRVGINFGANQFTLNTKNFQTKPGLGWNGGLSIRGFFTIIGTWFMVFNSAKTILPSLQRATFSK